MISIPQKFKGGLFSLAPCAEDDRNIGFSVVFSDWRICLSPFLRLFPSQSSFEGFTSLHNSLEQVKDTDYHHHFPSLPLDRCRVQFIKMIASRGGKQNATLLIRSLCMQQTDRLAASLDYPRLATVHSNLSTYSHLPIMHV